MGTRGDEGGGAYEEEGLEDRLQVHVVVVPVAGSGWCQRAAIGKGYSTRAKGGGLIRMEPGGVTALLLERVAPTGESSRVGQCDAIGKSYSTRAEGSGLRTHRIATAMVCICVKMKKSIVTKSRYTPD